MKQKTLLIAIALLLTLFNCSKDKDDDSELSFREVCNPVSYNGLNISIDGDISDEIDPMSSEYAAFNACLLDCAETSPDDMECMMDCMGLLSILPAGGAFSLTIYVSNTTTSDIIYVVEPGDWFEPGSGDYQPMMSPVSMTRVIPAGEMVTIVIPVYCLASAKSSPDEDSEYTMCNMISSGGCLADILELLQTKNQSSFGIEESILIQQIIWNCIEGNEVDWDYLNSLP